MGDPYMAGVIVIVSVAVNIVLLTVKNVVAGTYTVVLVIAVTVETSGHEAARILRTIPRETRSDRRNMVVAVYILRIAVERGSIKKKSAKLLYMYLAINTEGRHVTILRPLGSMHWTIEVWLIFRTC
jgi:hypothetical protein